MNKEQIINRLIEQEIYTGANQMIQKISDDPPVQEVMQFWLVSDWLADKLEAIDAPLATADWSWKAMMEVKGVSV